MAELKTKPNDGSVEAFLNSVEDEKKRQDGFTLLQIMQDITGERAQLWGPSIIGFGNYHYKYESGREGDWFLTGFSPRKQALSLYIMAGFRHYEELLKQLGKYKTGKACLYIKKLEDIDLEVLKKMIAASVEQMREKNG